MGGIIIGPNLARYNISFCNPHLFFFFCNIVFEKNLLDESNQLIFYISRSIFSFSFQREVHCILQALATLHLHNSLLSESHLRPIHQQLRQVFEGLCLYSLNFQISRLIFNLIAQAYLIWSLIKPIASWKAATIPW